MSMIRIEIDNKECKTEALGGRGKVIAECIIGVKSLLGVFSNIAGVTEDAAALMILSVIKRTNKETEEAE